MTLRTETIEECLVASDAAEEQGDYDQAIALRAIAHLKQLPGSAEAERKLKAIQNKKRREYLKKKYKRQSRG